MKTSVALRSSIVVVPCAMGLLACVAQGEGPTSSERANLIGEERTLPDGTQVGTFYGGGGEGAEDPQVAQIPQAPAPQACVSARINGENSEDIRISADVFLTSGTLCSENFRVQDLKLGSLKIMYHLYKVDPETLSEEVCATSMDETTGSYTSFSNDGVPVNSGIDTTTIATLSEPQEFSGIRAAQLSFGRGCGEGHYRLEATGYLSDEEGVALVVDTVSTPITYMYPGAGVPR